MWRSTNTAYPNIVVTQFLTSGLEGTPHHARKSSSHSASSKEQIVTMSAHMRPSQIARVTGISTRTIRRTKELWWKMGAVQRDSTTGMQLIYLPPYSPDFNPIEESFSAIKAWIRANRDYTRSELSDDATPDPYTMIWEAVYMTVTPTKAEGYEGPNAQKLGAQLFVERATIWWPCAQLSDGRARKMTSLVDRATI
jgi:transposase